VSEVPNPAEAVNELAERFWNGVLELSPITATVLGYDQADDRLDDPGPEGRDRARRLLRETLRATNEIEEQARRGCRRGPGIGRRPGPPGRGGDHARTS